MPQYTEGKTFSKLIYNRTDCDLNEFECCTFSDCDFSACHFTGVAFVDCLFERCNFSGTALNHTALRKATFLKCQMKELNFAMTEKFIFEVHFKDCTLDFSKFYGIQMNAATFVGCSLIAVDFMGCDLQQVLFDDCDLFRCEFEKADARKCDFTSSRNLSLDPDKTRLKGARIARGDLPGLLKHWDINAVY